MIKNLHTVYPSSPLLSKHIYCYYIIERAGPDFTSAHHSFPHTFNALSMYSHGSHTLERHRISVDGNSGTAPFSILQGKCTKPLLVELKGDFSRLTILFKPLGLNHFINTPLGAIMGIAPSLFTQWDTIAYNTMINALFSSANIKERIPLLEKFLVSIYRPVNLSSVIRSLEYMSDFDNKKSVEEIASLVHIPTRTFNRIFKLHLGIAPTGYRQIAQFRHSLENKLFNERFKTLTNICYSSNFYDQSYFNKIYKQLSGANPTQFFQTAQQVGDSKLVFRYI